MIVLTVRRGEGEILPRLLGVRIQEAGSHTGCLAVTSWEPVDA